MRQILVRIECLPPNTPLNAALIEAQEQADVRRREADVLDVLDKFKPT